MNTKIICTIGPSVDTEEKITSLIKNGVDIARFNFSHNTHIYHKEKINLVRKIARKYNKNIGILCDLQGPKIRIVNFSGPPILLKSRQKIILTTRKCTVQKKNQTVELGIDDKYLHVDVKNNDRILIDDGKIELKVIYKRKYRIFCRVLNGGEIYPRKGLNLPTTSITTNSLTKKDKNDLNFILTLKPEYIALSFVQSKEDVQKIRRLIGTKNIKIVSKIERAPALDNLDAILNATDIVMVARGDLGVEIPIEELPIIQKQIIKKCNYKNIFVIAATQFLDSMTQNPYPTRSEATDVANAVFDGVNAIMLTDETAVGRYPIKSLKTLVKIVRQSEKYLYKEVFYA